MAIPAEASWGDLAVGMNLKSLSDAGASLLLDGARSHQGHNARLSMIGENLVAGWGNLLISNDAREAAADRATLTGREAQNIGETLSTVGILAKIFNQTPPQTG